MTNNKIRHIIALILIIGFLSLISFLIIYPYISDLSGLTGNNEIMMKYLEKTSSLFTGIIGIIIGYYFGNRND